MLLPALGKAREKARNTHCLNNLKQIGLCNCFYINDSDDMLLPWVYYGKGKSGSTEALYWCGLLLHLKYLSSSNWDGYTHDPAGYDLPAVFKPKGVFACPAMSSTKGDTDSVYNGVNYGLGLYIGGYTSYNTTVCFSKSCEISNQSSVSLITESNFGADGKLQANCNSGDTACLSEQTRNRHNGSMNVLYLDGHASSHPAARIPMNNDHPFWGYKAFREYWSSYGDL